ncbi:MAG: flagellar M-ring protein FliF C-terminal domain-containing protein, partial [Thermoguttaceae bacterium]
ILNALSYIPNVTVAASVTLDTKKKSRLREIKHDPKTVVVQQSEQSTTRSQSSGGSGGRVGFEGQQPNTAATLTAGSAGGAKQEEEESKSEAVSVTSGQESDTEIAGLTPKIARASISVPMSYFKNVWLQRNPPAEGKEQKEPEQAALDQIRTEESAKIQKCVAQLLLPAEGVENPLELVTVTAFQDIPGKELPKPSTIKIMLAWLSEYWSVLGMIFIALGSLLMLRSLVGSAPALPEAQARQAAPKAPLAAPRIVSGMTPVEEEMPETEMSAALPARHFMKGPSLRDELSRMVVEDPDTAADILRGWISNAT